MGNRSPDDNNWFFGSPLGSSETAPPTLEPEDAADRQGMFGRNAGKIGAIVGVLATVTALHMHANHSDRSADVAAANSLLVPTQSANAAPGHRHNLPTSSAPSTTPTSAVSELVKPAKPSRAPSSLPSTVAPPPPSDPNPPITVVSANFLGAWHTGKNGNKPYLPNYQPRMRGEVKILNHVGADGADIIGAQELERPQRKLFLKLEHGSYAAYPKEPDYTDHFAENTVFYRKDKFSLDKAAMRSIGEAGYDTTRYFHNNHTKTPRIILKYLLTGAKVVVANFHDPANTGRFPHQTENRVHDAHVHARANLGDIALGYPVINIGDANSSEQARRQDKALGGQTNLLTPRILTDESDMRLAWNVAEIRPADVISKFGKVIDLVAVSHDIQVLNVRRVPTDGNSDHKFTKSVIRLPSTS